VSRITYGATGGRYFLSNASTIPDLNRTTQMTRREHEELQRKLARALKLALEPTDPLSQERAAQAIEDLEYQLFAGRHAAQAIQAGY
jgi:hypothetical protein